MEFRASTSCTPFKATKINYIPQYQKLCLSVSEAHKVYEAIQQDKPVYPTKISLGLDRTKKLLSETDASNPYAAALHKDLDSEFQEEPMSAGNEADLSWSILTTQVKYKNQVKILASNP